MKAAVLALLLACGHTDMHVPTGPLEYEADAALCRSGATLAGQLTVTRLGRSDAEGNALVGGTITICGWLFDWWGVEWAPLGRVSLYIDTQDLLPLAIEASVVPGGLEGEISGRGVEHARFRAWRIGERRGKVPYDPPEGQR